MVISIKEEPFDKVAAEALADSFVLYHDESATSIELDYDQLNVLKRCIAELEQHRPRTLNPSHDPPIDPETKRTLPAYCDSCGADGPVTWISTIHKFAHRYCRTCIEILAGRAGVLPPKETKRTKSDGKTASQTPKISPLPLTIYQDPAAGLEAARVNAARTENLRRRALYETKEK